MAEFSYTAYGELLTASSHAPHPDPRLGHKGLFLDRLDTGVVNPLTGAEVARHVLGAKHTYYMVNRSYDPQLGRFLQRDPNATGLPVIAEALYAGTAIGGGAHQFALEWHLGDGVGVYGYVASTPWMKSDPVGLFSYTEILAATTIAASLVPGPSDFITGALGSMVAEYSMRQEDDLYWALDWDAADDAHSRTEDEWITLAILRGIYDAFEIEIPGTDLAINPLDYFASRGGRGKKGADHGGRKAGSRNLRALGMEGVRLSGRSLQGGRKQLQESGFDYLGRTKSGRHEFFNSTTGAKVAFDPGTGKRKYVQNKNDPNHRLSSFRDRPHWHITDRSGQSYDKYGRPVDGNSAPAHIPAR